MVFIKVYDMFGDENIINSNNITLIRVSHYSKGYCVKIYIDKKINKSSTCFYYEQNIYDSKELADNQKDKLFEILNENYNSINEIKDMIKYMPNISLEYNKAKYDFEHKIE